MKKAKILFLTLSVAACYTRGLEAAYDDVGVSARVTGMGNAFTAVADDAYAVYYNPAGLGTLDRAHLATTYSRLFAGLSDNSSLQNSFLAFARPLDGGRLGGWGLAWNYFTLDGLYREMSLYGAYGRKLFSESLPGLYAGASLKYLTRSVGKVAAADNAFSNTGAVQVGVADPVLQKGARSNLDADVGLLYRLHPRVSVGLAVQHLWEPDIAFSSSDKDKLGRNYKLGAAYQTPWTDFSADLGLLKAPDASTDKVLTLAVEKWLPTLVHGTFGVRGALGVGDRSYRQASMGLSYRIHRVQVDYGFAIPLGTVSGTLGTHRMGLSFRFGRARGTEPKFAEAMLENMLELPSGAGAAPFRAQARELAFYARRAQQEFLRQANVETGEGRLASAKERLEQALAINPRDPFVKESLERMILAAAVYPDIPNFRVEPSMAALYEGVLDFLLKKDKDALSKVAYARSLNPSEERLERLLQVMERKAGFSRPEREAPAVAVSTPAAPAVSPEAEAEAARRKAVERTLSLMELAMLAGDYDKILDLSREVLSLEPSNILAHKRMAGAHYAKKDYLKALESLRVAYALEKEPEAQATLRGYIDTLVGLLERKAREEAAPAAPAGVGVPAAATQAPAESGVPARAGRPSPAGAGVPARAPAAVPAADIRQMYEAAVDLYAQGRLPEAARLFQRILDADPKNASARKALRRVQAELQERQP